MKVSVAMITYNHERFIVQAIESVLMQETSFDYELVIGEDCSTDRTREIVVDYQRRFPERIRLLLRDGNVGAQRNFAQVLAACTGQYVALLEGDDYWTAPHKLQSQVDFMDAQPECSICFHPVRWVYDDEHKDEIRTPVHNSTWPVHYREFSTASDLLREMFIQTASVMFRRALLSYPEWLYDLMMADWPLYVMLADRGRIGCLNDVMSVYRSHPGGIWFAVEEERRSLQVIKMYECLNAHFDGKYSNIIRPILASRYIELAVFYDQRGSHAKARTAVVRSLVAQLGDKTVPSLNTIKMLARLCFPALYAISKRLIKA